MPPMPPLDLAVEVIDAAGVRTRWDPGDEIAGNRPQGVSFSTKRGDGFAEGSVTLARRIDRDYVDLNLFDDVTFVGADGSTAYEGRIGAQPRSFDDAHSISVALAGWMSHARDQPFTAVYVDRDLGAWQPPSRSRQATLLAGNNSVQGFDAARDTTNALPALIMKIEGAWVSPYAPVSEALYDAGANNLVSQVYYWTQGGPGVASGPNFGFEVHGGSSDASFDVHSGDLWAGTDLIGYTPVGAVRRYIAFTFSFPTTPGGADGASYTLGLRNLAVYGYTNVSPTGPDPKGFAASDVITDIASQYCPMLNTAGVQDTTYPIPHLVFRDQTDPYDAFLEVNKYHLFELGVWENKTLTYAPANLTDYDWEVRLSDFGVKVELQGDSIADLANGIIVEYDDVQSGRKDALVPSVVSELQDTNPDNPANTHGITRWAKLTLTSPTTRDAAIQIGRTALVESNQPKAPGTITVAGHLRDRAGHWQQGWKVRAGDTIAITDHPNDSPRLVTETSWNHDSKQLTITVDSTNQRIEALFDRVSTALTAAGLS